LKKSSSRGPTQICLSQGDSPTAPKKFSSLIFSNLASFERYEHEFMMTSFDFMTLSSQDILFLKYSLYHLNLISDMSLFSSRWGSPKIWK